MRTFNFIFLFVTLPWVVRATNAHEKIEVSVEPTEAFLLFFFLLAILFLVFKTFRQKEVVEGESPPTPPLKDLIRQEVDLKELGPFTKMGSKLIHEAEDVETYLMLAEVDKGQLRAEEKAKAKAQARTRVWRWALRFTALLVAFALAYMAFTA